MRNKKKYLILILFIISIVLLNNCGTNFLFFDWGKKWVSFVTFNKSGDSLITVGNEIIIWDFLNQKKLKSISGNIFKDKTGQYYGFRYSSLSPNGKYLATWNYNNTISIWDIEKLKEIKNLIAHTNEAPYYVKFSQNGKYLMGYSYWDKTIKIWDGNNFNEISLLTENNNNISEAVFSSDENYVVFGTFSTNGGILNKNELIIWDFINKEIVYKTKIDQIIESIDFNTQDNYFAISGKTYPNMEQNYYGENILTIWDFKTKKNIKTIKLGDYKVKSNEIIFSNDGKFLACTIEGLRLNGTIKIFNTENWGIFKEIIVYPENQAYMNSILSINFSNDNNYVAASTPYSTPDDLTPNIKIWNLNNMSKNMILKP